MVLPEFGSGVWMGIGFGLAGLSFWIVGILVFRYLLHRSERGPQGAPADRADADDSLGDR